jgi:hypothetical protein
MNHKAMRDSVHARLGHLSDDHIKDLALMHAPGDEAARHEMAKTLIARKHALFARVKDF